jgi:multidrug resistance efflux pump
LVTIKRKKYRVRKKTLEKNLKKLTKHFKGLKIKVDTQQDVEKKEK